MKQEYRDCIQCQVNYCMQKSTSSINKVLITGGTSGLGLELVKVFLTRGYYIIATGRHSLNLPAYEDRFELCRTDFSDLKETAECIRNIRAVHDLNIIINNAGVLSPPDFIATTDGFEYTFQVNFLAHLIINEMILRHTTRNNPLKIATVTSIVYKISKITPDDNLTDKDYSPLKAYSDSKLLLAIMCRYLSSKYQHLNLQYFSFDPGVFSSGIYRMQKKWFGRMYRIAAPFMRQPAKVANVLAELLTDHDITSGAIYNIRGRIRHAPELDSSVYENFWQDIYNKIDKYLK